MPSNKKHNLKDYAPHPFSIDYVYLHINIISASEVLVQSFLELSLGDKELTELELDGVGLDTREISLDGQRLSSDLYSIDANKLVISKKALAFAGARSWKLGSKVRLNPTENSSLKGMYLSSGVLVSQCEAEGFRHISWFIDRPDMLSRYICKLEADANLFPVLLSNGNVRERGDLPVGRHYCEYNDPLPKPCYLFAMVAGKLDRIQEPYQTGSGRKVSLNLYAAREQIDNCSFALSALQKAMRFDEQRYQLEYELDEFNIVAVEDFNAGAMENTSLNIFNSTCLLAKPDISTDADFERVEAIIAHEYFHNYTGNRVTLRDWFQLCWKEGITVYRDQQFTAAEHSAALKRTDDVALIQERQFLEDQSSLRHAPRPSGYNEIDNLYTLTVYEKGAEIMRVLENLLGSEQFASQLSAFLKQHSGQAITIEQFLSHMLASSPHKPEKFLRWFTYAGCPQLQMSWSPEADGLRTLDVRQLHHDGKPMRDSDVLLIPLSVALIDQRGVSEEQSLLLDKAHKQWTFGCDARSTISVLRDFSAPVRLLSNYSLEELALIQDNESDAVNRWWANRQIWRAALLGEQQDQAWRLLSRFFNKTLDNWRASDVETKLINARLMQEPPFEWFVDQYEQVEPIALHRQIQQLSARISTEFADHWRDIYQSLWQQRSHSYIWNGEQRALRVWQNLALKHLFAKDPGDGIIAVSSQVEQCNNFTDASAALGTALALGSIDQAKRISTLFKDQWAKHNHGYQRWLRCWAVRPQADTLTQVQLLMESPRFLLSNPNHVYSLIYAFANNKRALFMQPEISLAFIEAQITRIDAKNPQLAARLATSLADNPKLDANCRELLRASRTRMLQQPLSGQTSDQLAG